MIRLAPGPAELIDEVPWGRLYVDGAVTIAADDADLIALNHRLLSATSARELAMEGGDRKSVV